MALGLGLLVAHFAGQRLPGQTVSGGIAEDTNSRLAQARALLGTDPARSLLLYEAIKEVDPDNVEATTYLGWLLSIQAANTGSADSITQAEGLLDDAIALDPQRADAYCFKAVVRFRFLKDAATARTTLDQCVALHPPAEVTGLVEGLSEEIDAALAGGAPATTASRGAGHGCGRLGHHGERDDRGSVGRRGPPGPLVRGCSPTLLRSRAMSDLPPDPDLPTTPSEPVATPPPVAEPAPAMPTAPPPPTVTYGQVPRTVNEVYYKTVANILLTIITCGIWFGVYAYRTHGDLKRYSGDGLGELAGLLLGIFIHPVVMFTIPYEVEKMYQRDGRQSPVSPLWGLWFLLPFIGWIIWYPKVQRALNDFWVSKGAQPAV